jgi:energy-coupling factor transporter ATP-binding protein EcfA2
VTAAGQPPAIRRRGLAKRYGDVTAIAGIDLTVAAGECFGLLGPNGAGKTTTVEVLEGLTPAPGSRYIDFLIPGPLGMNLSGSGLWGVGFAVVQARTKGLLKRFLATPMRKSEYLLSYMLSRLLFLILEGAALVGFGWWVFGSESGDQLWPSVRSP